MAKIIPTEQLIALFNKMDPFAPRHPERQRLILEMANGFGVSESTVRRQLRDHVHLMKPQRSDNNRPRVLSPSDMLLYCRLIAALKVRTSNKKQRHLSTAACIRILEDHGVATDQGFVKAPKNLLTRTTINRYLQKWGYDTASMCIEPVVVRFEAEQSNDCWQFDFSPSDLKRFSKDDVQSLFIASVTDDKSGVLYSQYIQADGEDALTALKFLYQAMTVKKTSKMPFQGIPKMLYTDNGAFAKSSLFKRALMALGIELKKHSPRGKDGRRTTSRSKGKIERTNRTLKESFESLFHLHRPKDLTQANEWLLNYLRQYNHLPHRSENMSRLEAWKRFLPSEGFREMCSWEKFCQIVREPETRIVGSDACVSFDGTKFQLTAEMAGSEVTLLLGVFDNELYVEFKGEKYGPFYPSKGPIPLHTYKRPLKTQKEKDADDIGHLAKTLSVPLSVMTGETPNTVVRQLERAHVIHTPSRSIPFEEQKSLTYRNRLEAKQGIANYLNRPLAELTPEQLTYINQIVAETLDRELVLNKIKKYFRVTLYHSKNKES